MFLSAFQSVHFSNETSCMRKLGIKPGKINIPEILAQSLDRCIQRKHYGPLVGKNVPVLFVRKKSKYYTSNIEYSNVPEQRTIAWIFVG